MFECGEGSRGRSELRNSLFHEQFCRFGFRHDTNASSGFSMNDVRFRFTEVVTVLSAPPLVFVCECSFGFPAAAAVMPKLFYKVHPLFAPVPADWA